MEVNPILSSPNDSVSDGGISLANCQDHAVTVLLVEDTEDNRQMLKKLLELSDFCVFEATNGREAVEMARQVRPQIILMDLSLPFVDGLSATRQIRNLPGFSKVPIVAVTAHDTSDFHSEALNAGCDAYVTKPVCYPELEELVNRLVAEAH